MPKLERISQEEKKPLRVGLILLLTAAVLILLVVKVDEVSAALSTLSSAVIPFLLGIAIAFFLNVFVTLFERFLFKPLDKRIRSKRWDKIKRPLAMLLAVALVIALILFITLFIIPELINSMRAVMESAQKTIPEYVNSFTVLLEKFLADNNLNFDVEAILGVFNWESLISNATKFTTDFLTTIYDATKNIVSAVFTGIVAFIFSIYLLFGKENLMRNVKRMLFAYVPQKTAKKIVRVSSLTNQVFYSFIKGQLLESVILGSLCYIGMLIFRFDYALLISAVIWMTALIPILGAFIGASVGAFILLLGNPFDAVWFLVFIIILQQVETNIIYPRVVGSSIGLPAVWTMFAVLFWGTILGIPGVLLGTPVTAVIYKLLRSSTKDRLKERGIGPEDLEPGKQIQETGKKAAVDEKAPK